MKNVKLIMKCSKAIAKAALYVGKDSVTKSYCICWYHQPQVPQAMEKFKK